MFHLLKPLPETKIQNNEVQPTLRKSVLTDTSSNLPSKYHDDVNNTG